MQAYMRYTIDASKMEAVLSLATNAMTKLSEELICVQFKIDSLVPVIHILSTTPTTIASLNEVIMSEYHPALSRKTVLIAEIDSQRKQIESMQLAMLDPKYVADRDARVAMHLENARLKAEERSNEELINEVEKTLIDEAVQADIRSKIGRGNVYPDNLTQRSPIIEVGDVAWVQVFTGGRTHAVNWGVQCVVMKRAASAAGNIAYVVSLFDFYNDRLECRIVEEDALFGPPTKKERRED